MTSIDMTVTRPAQPKAPPVPRHGVDTPALFTTLDAVKAQPEIAKFQFRATCHWLQGTHSRSILHGFHGAGQEMAHLKPYTAEADHPAILCGEDHGVTPVEHLLHALASCLTAGIANIAAARGVTLQSVESTVEGDIDLCGIFGLSDEVRNGYREIRVRFFVQGDATSEVLRRIVQQSVARSAVYDMLTNGTDVSVETLAG
jgi:uncharacterized OsmC-like protein